MLIMFVQFLLPTLYLTQHFATLSVFLVATYVTIGYRPV